MGRVEIVNDLFKKALSDLGIGLSYEKGKVIPVRNCWHFCTDGNAVDAMFFDDYDFIDGMNGIFVVLQKYKVLVLAFVLMDTHFHFILYGDFDECNRFVHSYVARISRNISLRHGQTNKLDKIPISYQKIGDDRYLKTAICYVIKNPPVAGLRYMAWKYPWSSGSLYFNNGRHWTMVPCSKASHLSDLSVRDRYSMLKSRQEFDSDPRVYDGLVLPEEYVEYEIVESLFRSAKSFNFFLCNSKEDDVEERMGSVSRLSIPISEMRQHRRDVCKELFGVATLNTLTTKQRIRIARTLRRRFDCSTKQVARVCGLLYEEVKDVL